MTTQAQLKMRPTEDLHPDKVFVFGSNLGGYHGAGAAWFAHEMRKFPMYLGAGPAMDCYAIPTKDQHVKTLPLEVVQIYVAQFCAFAKLYADADIQFQVTRVGCGLAGFHDADIAPMFTKAPDNCWFDQRWQKFLGKRRYWGTF